MLQTEAVRRKLSLGQQGKVESQAHRQMLKLPSAISALEDSCSVQVLRDACGSANQTAEEMA
jgi:hypothetical protein